MGDGKDGWMSLMRNKTFWKVITGLLFFPTFAYGLLVISMYWWPSIPSTPRPAEGRIYPLNNHGEYAYMNRREHLMHEVYPLVILPVLAALAAIDYFVDPFDYKGKRRIYGRPPHDFR
jgi:hypothetical protein